MDTPVLGVQDTYEGPNKWQVSTTWRFQRSDRHFVGSDEQEERQEEGSEVVNVINLAEIGVRYNAGPHWSYSLSIPYLIATRSQANRAPDGHVVNRATTQAHGLGDIVLMGRRLMRDPKELPTGNISLGLGLKIPTGENGALATRRRLVNGVFVNSVETVDQSIQPGDGGVGFILEFQGNQVFGGSGFLGYLSAGYLINPQEDSGVPTFRNGAGEEIMSIADQYLARIGVAYSSASWKGWGVALGGRLEGVPVEDLIGGSEGFRRPGYAVSVEPATSYSRGPHTFSLAVPIAAYRNRTRSVPDRAVPGRHGDAAFADYIILLGYWRRF